MTIIPEDLSIHKPDKKLLKKINSTEIEEKILFQKQSDFHNILVVENVFGRFLKYKDTYQAGYINSKNYKGNLPYINYFLIPYLMNKNIKDILIIGFGSGIIINQYEKIFSKLKTIDIVDIEENIFPIAQKYFNFKISNKMNFYLQDALIYLKTIKKKYDLIVVDVASDDGIDERFCEIEYLDLVKKSLRKNGIFVSNMPSSRDIFNQKNVFVLNLLEKYKQKFDFIKLFSGKTSNKIYYKTFFDIDDEVYDVTNLIMISSDKDYKISSDFSELKKLGVEIKDYLEDLV